MRLVVIGGVAAGMSAASQAKRMRPDIEVVALERGEYVSYASCGIPYYISEVIKDHRSLIAVTPEDFRAKRNIDLRLRHEVLEVRPNRKTLSVRDVSRNKTFELEYDKLVIGTGAEAVPLDVPGADADNVFSLRSLQSGIAVMSFLHDRAPRRAVIVGLGYVGLEIAESFRARDMVVTAIAKPGPLLRLEPEISSIIEDELNDHGVVLKKNARVLNFEKQNDSIRRVITDDEEIEADIVFVSIGIRPSVELARSAGIALGSTGAIAVNERTETSVADIYAAGDCAEAFHRVSRKQVWIPLGDTANKQGRVAGANAAGGDETFPGIVGSSVAKVFELAVARTGLTLEEAKLEGFDADSHTITDRSRAGYYPGARKITITLIFDKQSQKLLGAQMVGPDGVAKRNDVLATAITAGMTLRDIENLDLSYAPPYSPVYDPILIAARQARKQK